MDTPDFKEHFHSLLAESEEHLAALDPFLTERLTQAGVSEPETAVAGIGAILDSIDRNHENLTSSKQQNKTSRAAWLQQSLTEQTSRLKEDQAATLIDAVTGSMTGDASASGHGNGSFSGVEAVAKVRNLDQALIQTTCQAQAELQTAILSAPDEAVSESELMRRAIEGKDPLAFKQVRKIAAVCLMTMESEKPLDYVSASMFADRGLYSVQTDYAVGSGECTESDGVERLIDRAAAQLKTWLDVAAPKLIDAGLVAISAFVTEHCPAAAPFVAKVAPIVRMVCQKSVIPAIRKGAEMIQTAAKNLWQRVKERCGVLEKVVNKVSNFLSAN